MPTSRRTLLKTSAAAAAAFSLDWTRAQAQAETVRIGLIYDLSGPFAAGGSVASSVGAQIAIDLVNEKGGIGGKYKIVPIAADSQSKPDVAINEAERLISQEKIDIISGVYASSHAVPLAAKVEQQKKILWITTAVATAVFKDKNLHYVFRAQIHSDQYGQAFASFITEHAKAKLGIEPKDVKVALIHEDGPYGVGVAAADEAYSKQAGLQVVLKEGYSAAAPDLSTLVTKIKRSGADVISHAGFNPEAIRKAALDVDIAPGGTIQGYGVKFFPPDTLLSGQNERSTPVVMQNAGEHISVVWPTNIRTQDPVFPLPKSSIYAA